MVELRAGMRATARQAAAVAAVALLAVTAVVGVLGASVVKAPPAFAALELAVGTEVTLSTPGIALRVPADGRLNGFDFHGNVSGAACGPAAGEGAQAVVAAPGAQVCVIRAAFVSERLADLKVSLEDFPPALRVVAGAVSVPIALSASARTAPGSQAGGIFAVGVPVNTAVTLEVADHGYTQRFDVLAAARLGPDATVLYRSAAASTVEAPRPPGAPVLAAVRSDTGATTSWQILLDAVYLSFFDPVTGGAAPTANDAYLVIDGSMRGSTGALDVPALGASAVSVVLPDGRHVPARAAPTTSLRSSDLFARPYSFEVPANLTAASLNVAIAAPGVRAIDDATGATVVLAFAQPATIPLSWGPGPRPPGVTARVAPASGPRLIYVAIAALVVLAGAAVISVLVARRRRAPLVPTLSRRMLLAATPGELIGPLRPAELARPPAELGPGPPLAVAEQSPHGPQAEEAPALVVAILGPVRIEGLVRPLRRKALRRLLLCLVLTPAGSTVTVDQLRDLTATDVDQPPSAATIRQAASRLRHHLPDALLPPIDSGMGGYRLGEGAEIDWALFVELAARAGDQSGAERLELSCRALGLVDGPPFEGETWAGIDAWVRHLEATIECVALDTARLALELGDAPSAEWAASQGLRAVPGVPVLYELRLMAARSGSGVGLERAWAQTQAALGPDAVALAVTFDRLRAGEA